MEAQNFKKYTPLTVWWKDTYTSSDMWRSDNEMEGACIGNVISRGFFVNNGVQDGIKFLRIAQDVEEDGDCNSVESIPWGSIYKIKKK